MCQFEFPSRYPYQRGDKVYTSRVVVGHTQAGRLVVGIEDKDNCQVIHMPLDQAESFLEQLTGVIEILRSMTSSKGIKQ